MTSPVRYYGNHAPTSTGLCVFNVPPSPGQRQAVGPAPATAPGLAGRGDGRGRSGGPAPLPRLPRACGRAPGVRRGGAEVCGQSGRAAVCPSLSSAAAWVGPGEGREIRGLVAEAGQPRFYPRGLSVPPEEGRGSPVPWKPSGRCPAARFPVKGWGWAGRLFCRGVFLPDLADGRAWVMASSPWPPLGVASGAWASALCAGMELSASAQLLVSCAWRLLRSWRYGPKSTQRVPPPSSTPATPPARPNCVASQGPREDQTTGQAIRTHLLVVLLSPHLVIMLNLYSIHLLNIT